MKAVIHCCPGIPWQPKRAAYFAEGFKRAGIPYEITDSRERQEGLPVLLGTSMWRGIEATGDYLLVDRCSFGDTEKYVSLVWNAHGRRGDHRLPDHVTGERWESMGRLLPWRPVGECVVLCGQCETYSPHYPTTAAWYARAEASHFRPHPADPGPYPLPLKTDFENAVAVTLNSSIGVKCVIEGIPTITMDEGAMAWDVTGHSLDDIRTPDREAWAHRLAWTQWSDDEIREGDLWASRWY